MRLVDLEPTFLRRLPDGNHQLDVDIKVADGVMFLCPKCFRLKKGMVGTHMVICWRPHVPPDVTPKPGRWEFQGMGLWDLSLVAKSSSVKLESGCLWHGYVTNGEVTEVD